MKPENQLSYRPGGQALDTAIFGFAVFTLLCHMAVAFQLGLDALIQISTLALLLGVATQITWSRRSARTDPRIETTSSFEPRVRRNRDGSISTRICPPRAKN